MQVRLSTLRWVNSAGPRADSDAASDGHELMTLPAICLYSKYANQDEHSVPIMQRYSPLLQSVPNHPLADASSVELGTVTSSTAIAGSRLSTALRLPAPVQCFGGLQGSRLCCGRVHVPAGAPHRNRLAKQLHLHRVETRENADQHDPLTTLMRAWTWHIGILKHTVLG